MARKRKKSPLPLILSLSLVVLCAALIWGSFHWTGLKGLGQVAGVEIAGNRLVADQELMRLLGDLDNTAITGLDLRESSKKLEKHPYIAAARLSRIFPRRLRVEIHERRPLVMVNNAELVLIDDQGIVLPRIGGGLDYQIPFLSGFNPDANLYPIGEQALSVKVKSTVALVSRVKDHFPGLFANLSEVTINQQDEYLLILAEKPTRINLGDQALIERIYTLVKFERALGGIKLLSDYAYLDLRYAKQIIAKEWS